jgi:ABC-type multidrug transport system ATPase subunit
MEEAELLADTVAIIAKGRLIAMGSPGELIESNANYLALTLQVSDDTAFGTLSKMGFEPTRGQPNTLKVKVKDASDVQRILTSLKDEGTPLLGLDVRKPNLEEVFLKLTGEAPRESPTAERTTT